MGRPNNDCHISLGWSKIDPIGLQELVTTFDLKKVPGEEIYYAENFIQAVFDVAERPDGSTLVIGGDGRFHNRTVIAQAIRMAAANGYARVLVGQGGQPRAWERW